MSARTAIERAKAQFEFYARQHQAKMDALVGSMDRSSETEARVDDARRKAKANLDFAAEMDAELARLTDDVIPLQGIRQFDYDIAHRAYRIIWSDGTATAHDFGETSVSQHGWVAYNSGPSAWFWSETRENLVHELSDIIRPATALEKSLLNQMGNTTDQFQQEGTLAERVAIAMSETAPSWGWRIAHVLSVIGLDFGTAEQLDWGMMRDAHREISYSKEALAAFAAGNAWPPLSHDFAVWKGQWRPELFRIRLPDETWAEVRPGVQGTEVWIIDPEHHEGEYRSAGFKGEHAFENAVRNIVGPVWEAALPF